MISEASRPQLLKFDESKVASGCRASCPVFWNAGPYGPINMLVYNHIQINFETNLMLSYRRYIIFIFLS